MAYDYGQLDKRYVSMINEQARKAFGRELTPSEMIGWYNNLHRGTEGYKSPEDVYAKMTQSPEGQKYLSGAGDRQRAEYASANPITEDKVKAAYRTYLGREPAAEEVQGWMGVDPNDFDKIFQEASSGEIKGRLTTLGSDLMAGKIPGYDEALQKQAVEQDYETARQQMRGQLEEAAAGGGFETSGYYASIAKGETGLSKAKITTLAEMNKALSEYKVNMSLKGADILSGLEAGKLSLKQYNDEMANYNREMADYRAALKKSQDEWWRPVLGGIAGAWLGPGGIWAGASAAAGAAAGEQSRTSPGVAPVQPTKPTGMGYYEYSAPLHKDYFSTAFGNTATGGKY